MPGIGICGTKLDEVDTFFSRRRKLALQDDTDTDVVTCNRRVRTLGWDL